MTATNIDHVFMNRLTEPSMEHRINFKLFDDEVQIEATPFFTNRGIWRSLYKLALWEPGEESPSRVRLLEMELYDKDLIIETMEEWRDVLIEQTKHPASDLEPEEIEPDNTELAEFA